MAEEFCNFVQGSRNPAFKSRVASPSNLECAAGCGQVLIEGFFPECFIEISIRCFNCHAITKTPAIEDGEVLSAVVAMVTKGKSYLIGSTVEYDPSVIMSSENAVERVRQVCQPLGEHQARVVNADLVSFTRSRYEGITSVDYELQRKIVGRNGVGVKFEYPLVWALETISKTLNDGASLSGDLATKAIRIVELFNSVCDRWGNSHRFPQVARQMGNKKNFFHTVFSLMAADMLSSDGGALVGLSLEDQEGVPNPDLYIRRGASEKFHLEVKAPEDFQIVADFIEEARTKSRLLKVLKGSSGQINRNSRGVLIVGASIDDDGVVRDLEKWMRNLVKSRGQFHSGLAALAIIVRRSDAAGPFYELISASNEHYPAFNPWRSN